MDADAGAEGDEKDVELEVAGCLDGEDVGVRMASTDAAAAGVAEFPAAKERDEAEAAAAPEDDPICCATAGTAAGSGPSSNKSSILIVLSL